MKQKWVPILLAFLMAVIACLSFLYQAEGEASVSFYYPRKDFAYASQMPVIVPEKRDVSPHQNDLVYLMRLYLGGPVDQNLRLPFPSRTRLVSCEILEDEVQIVLTEAGLLSESAYALACTCMSRTCMDLIPVHRVTITSGNRSLTTELDGMLLVDETTLGSPTTTGENVS